MQTKEDNVCQWDDLECCESEEHSDAEEAMLCFLAMEDNNYEDNDNEVNNKNLFHDDLF